MYKPTRSDQARFRPVVDLAWSATCAFTGRNPSDRAAKDRWYRDQVSSATAGRIRSTKQVEDRAEFEQILRRFLALSQDSPPPSLDGLTDAQNAIFAQLSVSAWQAACSRSATRAQFSVWVQEQLASCGVRGDRVRNHITDFDEILAHFAILANDKYWLSRCADPAERRLRYLIDRLLAALTEQTGDPCGWSYVRGVLTQMSLPADPSDCPARDLSKVHHALSIHLARLRKRSQTPVETPF